MRIPGAVFMGTMMRILMWCTEKKAKRATWNILA